MRMLVCKPTVRVVAFTPALIAILSVLLDVCALQLPLRGNIYDHRGSHY